MKQIFAAAAMLALLGCQQNDPNDIAIDGGNEGNVQIEILPPDETAASELNASGNLVVPAPPNADNASIPPKYHGRWGMVAADCTSTRGDAKGLIAIDGKRIKFYESVAVLEEQRPAIATSFAGLFSFTGEGQQWRKVMSFSLAGDTLKRTEEEGSFTYQRCAG